MTLSRDFLPFQVESKENNSIILLFFLVDYEFDTICYYLSVTHSLYLLHGGESRRRSITLVLSKEKSKDIAHHVVR